MGGGGEQSELRVGVNILKKGVHGGDGFFASTTMIMLSVKWVCKVDYLATALCISLPIQKILMLMKKFRPAKKSPIHTNSHVTIDQILQKPNFMQNHHGGRLQTRPTRRCSASHISSEKDRMPQQDIEAEYSFVEQQLYVTFR